MRISKLEVMQHLKRLHAAHGIPEHHKGTGLDLVATEFHNALRWEDSQAVEKAIDELCASDSRFFPKPGAVLAVARKHRPVGTGPGFPEFEEDDRCVVCGERPKFWLVQRDDGTEYTRLLTRHDNNRACVKYNGDRKFLREDETWVQTEDRKMRAAGEREAES